MSHITGPHGADLQASVSDLAPGHAPSGGTGPTMTESVVTTLTGIAVGGATIWFLAPICFTC